MASHHLKPIRESVGVSPKNIRNSCFGVNSNGVPQLNLSNASHVSHISRVSHVSHASNFSNTSSVFDKNKVSTKKDQSFMGSPKPKMQLCHSPRQSHKKQEALKRLT